MERHYRRSSDFLAHLRGGHSAASEPRPAQGSGPSGVRDTPESRRILCAAASVARDCRWQILTREDQTSCTGRGERQRRCVLSFGEIAVSVNEFATEMAGRPGDPRSRRGNRVSEPPLKFELRRAAKVGSSPSASHPLLLTVFAPGLWRGEAVSWFLACECYAGLEVLRLGLDPMVLHSTSDARSTTPAASDPLRASACLTKHSAVSPRDPLRMVASIISGEWLIAYCPRCRGASEFHQVNTCMRPPVLAVDLQDVTEVRLVVLCPALSRNRFIRHCYARDARL